MADVILSYIFFILPVAVAMMKTEELPSHSEDDMTPEEQCKSGKLLLDTMKNVSSIGEEGIEILWDKEDI
jgi:hypothetical protein